MYGFDSAKLPRSDTKRYDPSSQFVKGFMKFGRGDSIPSLLKNVWCGKWP